MLKSTLCALALLLTACTGGAPGGDDGDEAPDAGTGNACTGEAYDPCTDTVTWSDCADGMECRLFSQQGITICTPTCDADTPCPDQDGTAITCNQMGRCRGTAANACE